MTKEEIIDNIIYRQTDGEEYACLKKEDCMNAMQDYADQETERLKAELSELKKKHKGDVMEAFGDGWEKGIARPKLMCVNLEQYYKQKFEK